MSNSSKARESGGFPTMIGGSSLLVIFAVLCLTVFALLSLSTVMADKRLADASAHAAAAYYAADAEAEEIFARLRTGEVLDHVQQINDQYTYTCPISETQTLYVTVVRDGEAWKILRWQAVARAEMAEHQPDVWSGTVGTAAGDIPPAK